MNKIEGWCGDEDVCRHTLDEKYAISTRGIFEFSKSIPGHLIQKEIG